MINDQCPVTPARAPSWLSGEGLSSLTRVMLCTGSVASNAKEETLKNKIRYLSVPSAVYKLNDQMMELCCKSE